MENENYVCTRCRQTKTLAEMSLDSGRKHKISSWCKECRKRSARAWAKSNPEKIKNRVRTEDSETRRGYMYKHRYKFSIADYNQMFEEQGEVCAICLKKVKYLLHVDHCHTTGIVRGLLCAPCNAYLGVIKDDLGVLQRAIEYLIKTKKEQSAI